MTRSVEVPASPSPDHVGDAKYALTQAIERMQAAINLTEAALSAAKYVRANGELMRQLSIVRTQIQTAELWAISAEGCFPPAEEKGS